jgi:hypothetical protein
VLGACWTGSFGCNFGEKPKYEESAQKEESAKKEERAQKDHAEGRKVCRMKTSTWTRRIKKVSERRKHEG